MLEKTKEALRAERCVCMVNQATQESTNQTAATLDRLEPGKDAVISAVKCTDVSLRKHILDMGLTPGTTVKVTKVAPLGDPLETTVRGYELSIRRADAEMIEIE